MWYVVWWNISACISDYKVSFPGQNLGEIISSDLCNVKRIECIIFYLFILVIHVCVCVYVHLCMSLTFGEPWTLRSENSGCWLLLLEHAECLRLQFMRGISVSQIALESLDLITIVVPPALPAAMTVGHFYAQNRLRAKNVYCISPRAINVSGSIDCVCFDKVCQFSEMYPNFEPVVNLRRLLFCLLISYWKLSHNVRDNFQY